MASAFPALGVLFKVVQALMNEIESSKFTGGMTCKAAGHVLTTVISFRKVI